MKIALREVSQSTIDHVAGQPGARKLARALALTEGFSFQLAVCATTRVATALQVWLAEAVEREREASVLIERLSPYPLDWREPGPASLDADELGELILAKLVGESGSEDRLVFVDAARARERDLEAWRAVLLRVNERRNQIARGLRAPLTLILPPSLAAEFGRLAPDLWSIRSVAVDVGDLAEVESGAGLLRAFESRPTTDEDSASLIAAVEVARMHARAGSEASQRSLLVLLLRLAGTRQRGGELADAERLLDEATGIAEALADPDARAACQLARSDLLVARGDYVGARPLIEFAMATFRQSEDGWALADAWGRLADILFTRGELDEALRICREEELPVYERLGDVRSRAVTLGRVADILQARGELDEALRIRWEEELPVYERLGDVRSLLVGRANLAVTLARRGRPADGPQIMGLLAAALADARRLRLPEVGQIEDLIRQHGGDPKRLSSPSRRRRRSPAR